MFEQFIFRDQGKSIIGRVIVDGSHLRVERRNPIDGSYIAIGRYEDLKNPADLKTRDRKIQEVDSIFDSWSRAAAKLEQPDAIKANWHHGEETPLPYKRPNSDLSGVLVVNYGTRVIARVYKTKENSGYWVAAEEP